MTPNRSSWDAVVVGSGVGGLACAATLAKTGHAVLVLKQHYVAGGFTQSSSRLSLGCGSISARWALRARPTQVPIGVFSDFPETEPLNSNRGSGADHTAALTQAGLVPLGADAFSS